jgi:hypothetical protein
MVLRGSPLGFRKSGCIGIVFLCYRYVELSLKLCYEVSALPSRQRSYITDNSGSGIERARTCDPDSSEFRACRRDAVKHLLDKFDSMWEPLRRVCGTLAPSDNRPIVADGAYCYFCSANVDSSKHAELLLVATAHRIKVQ